MSTPGGPTYGAFEALAVAGSAVGFTAATYDGDDAAGNVARRRFAHIMVSGGAIRYRVDGTDPTASVGTPVEVGSQIKLDNRDQLVNFKAIRRDGVSATLSTHFGK